MKRELWFSGSALAAGVLFAVAIVFAFPAIIDPDGRLRAAERERRERVAIVRSLVQAAKAEVQAGAPQVSEFTGEGTAGGKNSH